MNTEIKQWMYRIVSRLLQYPDSEWRESLESIKVSLPKPIIRFIDTVQAADPVEWEALYVKTFDFGKKTNLYVTYGEYGEERERGPVLLELKSAYENAGFHMNEGELSDYLPVMLEFASIAYDQGSELLARRRKAINKICDELEKADNPYASLFQLILSIIPELKPKQSAAMEQGETV